MQDLIDRAFKTDPVLRNPEYTTTMTLFDSQQPCPNADDHNFKFLADRYGINVRVYTADEMDAEGKWTGVKMLGEYLPDGHQAFGLATRGANGNDIAQRIWAQMKRKYGLEAKSQKANEALTELEAKRSGAIEGELAELEEAYVDAVQELTIAQQDAQNEFTSVLREKFADVEIPEGSIDDALRAGWNPGASKAQELWRQAMQKYGLEERYDTVLNKERQMTLQQKRVENIRKGLQKNPNNQSIKDKLAAAEKALEEKIDAYVESVQEFTQAYEQAGDEFRTERGKYNAEHGLEGSSEIPELNDWDAQNKMTESPERFGRGWRKGPGRPIRTGRSHVSRPIYPGGKRGWTFDGRPIRIGGMGGWADIKTGVAGGLVAAEILGFMESTLYDDLTPRRDIEREQQEKQRWYDAWDAHYDEHPEDKPDGWDRARETQRIGRRKLTSEAYTDDELREEAVERMEFTHRDSEGTGEDVTDEFSYPPDSAAFHWHWTGEELVPPYVVDSQGKIWHHVDEGVYVNDSDKTRIVVWGKGFRPAREARSRGVIL